MAGANSELDVRCVENVRSAMRAIVETSGSRAQMLERIDSLTVHAYTLPVRPDRLVIVLAGERA